MTVIDETHHHVLVPRDALQAVLDLAINSMDFGSGFWDHEECDAARRIAVLLGVSPWVATPDSLRGTYPHRFVVAPPGAVAPSVTYTDPTYRSGGHNGPACMFCRYSRGHSVHRDDAPEAPPFGGRVPEDWKPTEATS
jgi:hypothetical protein